MQRIGAHAIAALFAVTCLVHAAARAGVLVEFDGPGGEPDPVRLRGYLVQPTIGGGQRPAVILLHGCGGFSAHMARWAERLAGWGYVALAVDSIGPRRLAGCGRDTAAAQPLDAAAAVGYLTRLPLVHPSRIALLGFSLGGGSVLEALAPGSPDARREPRFRAAVAFYPVCAGKSGGLTAPLLIVVGERDVETPPATCRDILDHARDSGNEVRMVTYPGAGHGFDRETSPDGDGKPWTGYDPTAAADATDQVRRFLAAALGR